MLEVAEATVKTTLSALQRLFIYMAKTIEQENEILNPYPLMPNNQRIALWNNAKGIWKNRQPDPIEELEKQREEWDEDLPNNS